MADIGIMGVVGAGPMGAGIAQIGLTSGLQVILYDLNPAALEQARKDVLGRIARMVEKGQLPEGAVDDADGRFKLAGEIADFAPAQVVVEAIIAAYAVAESLPFLSAAESTPTPSGLPKMSLSPGLAPALRLRFLGLTSPMATKP